MGIVGLAEDAALTAVGGGPLVVVRRVLGTAGGFLAKVPREVWYALAALVLGWYVHHRGYDAGLDHDKSVITGLRTDLASANANTATANASTQSLIDAWTDVDAAITGWQARRDKDVADAHAATLAAQEREKARAPAIAALDKAGRSAAGKPACPVSAINRSAIDASL